MSTENLKWHPIVSSQIKEIAFDTEKKLFIRFNTGATYNYPDAPQSVYDEMVSLQDTGGSVGKYWNSVKGTLNFTKVE